MKAKLCLMIGTAFVLTACAVSAPTKHTVTMTRIKSVDYGAYPKNYEQRIRQDLENRLLDFDSAKIKIILPPKKHMKFQINIPMITIWYAGYRAGKPKLFIRYVSM